MEGSVAVRSTWRGSLAVIAQRVIATPTQELLNLIHNGVRIHIWRRPLPVSLVIGLFEASDIVREFRIGVDLFVERRLQFLRLLLDLFKVERQAPYLAQELEHRLGESGIRPLDITWRPSPQANAFDALGAAGGQQIRLDAAGTFIVVEFHIMRLEFSL